MGDEGEGLRPYYAAKRDLGSARVRVEGLCQYAFALAELLHPGFMAGLTEAVEQHSKAERAAQLAAFESDRL